MSKTVYRLEIIREFDDAKAAITAAERQSRMGGRRITVSQEEQTDSGQPFARKTIWQGKEQHERHQG